MLFIVTDVLEQDILPVSLEEGKELRSPTRHRLAQQLRVDACSAECRTTMRTNGGELENGKIIVPLGDG